MGPIKTLALEYGYIKIRLPNCGFKHLYYPSITFFGIKSHFFCSLPAQCTVSARCCPDYTMRRVVFRRRMSIVLLQDKRRSEAEAEAWRLSWQHGRRRHLRQVQLLQLLTNDIWQRYWSMLVCSPGRRLLWESDLDGSDCHLWHSRQPPPRPHHSLLQEALQQVGQLLHRSAQHLQHPQLRPRGPVHRGGQRDRVLRAWRVHVQDQPRAATCLLRRAHAHAACDQHRQVEDCFEVVIIISAAQMWPVISFNQIFFTLSWYQTLRIRIEWKRDWRYFAIRFPFRKQHWDWHTVLVCVFIFAVRRLWHYFLFFWTLTFPLLWNFIKVAGGAFVFPLETSIVQRTVWKDFIEVPRN